MLFKKTKQVGDEAEVAAIRYLSSQGLSLIAKNFQPSGRGMADLDIVMQDKDQTIVFVEVRMRSSADFGGAAASVTFAKQRRLIQSAQFFLMRFKSLPACRFDVIVFEGGDKLTPLWIQRAFDVKKN